MNDTYLYRKTILRCFSVVAAAFCLSAFTAKAEDPNEPFSLTLNAALVDSATGKADHSVPAEELAIGDTIEYQLVLTNRLESQAKSLRPSIPIPETCQFTGNCEPISNAWVHYKDGTSRSLANIIEESENDANNRSSLLSNISRVSWIVESLPPEKTAVMSLQAQFTGQ